MFKNVFFDLDGTIIDSREGIVNGFIYSLKYFNIEVKDRKEIEQFIGPPLEDSFINYYKFSKKDAELAITKYREFYKKTGVRQNTLYVGIKELLHELKNSGKNVLLATGKPEVFAKQILREHGLENDFDFISGTTLEQTRRTKAEVLEYAINSIKNVNLDECVMVGDRKYDIEGAKANNIKSIGVEYGFGTRQELTIAGAEYIAKNIEDLRKLII